MTKQMNYENLSKEELIELLNKAKKQEEVLSQSHSHMFACSINTETKKLVKTCECGFSEEIDLTLIETPSHKHDFKYSILKTKFDNDEKVYSVKFAECKNSECNEKRIYLIEEIELDENEALNVETSAKWMKKEEKTQIYYPKKEMNIVNFNGPNKQTYQGQTHKVFYIKSSDGKWYKATPEISKYILEHYKEWTEETETLFKVDSNKHIKN